MSIKKDRYSHCGTEIPRKLLIDEVRRIANILIKVKTLHEETKRRLIILNQGAILFSGFGNLK